MQTPRLALALAVAVIVICARIVAGGETWADIAYHTEVVPARLAAADQVAHGSLPGWWDGAGLGVPLLAEPSHGAAYPLVWLARSPRALDWLIVIHLAWAALGIAIWARRRGASELAALAAGLFAVTAGAVTAAGMRGALFGIAHLPWIAWSAEAVRERRASVVLGASLGLVALSGQLGILIDGVVLALVLGRLHWRLAAAIGAGLAIGALQWLPALATLGTTAGAKTHGLPLARLVELVAPGRLYIGASVLALAALGATRRLAIAAAAASVLAVLRVGAPELQLAVIAVLAAGAAAPGLDELVAGERRALIALAAGAAVTLAALAIVHDHERMLVHGGIGVASTLAAVVLAWRAAPAPWRTPVVLALVLAPGVGALGIVAPTAERSIVEDEPAWVHAIGERPHPVRMFRPAVMPDVPAELGDAIATLAGTSAVRWGIDAARTDDPARPPDTDRTWAAASHDGGALLERYGITLAIVPAQMVAGAAHKPLAERGAYALLDRLAIPPAVVALDWTFTVDVATALAELFPDGKRAPQTLVVLAGHGAPSQESTGHMAPCTIDQWRDGAIDLGCTSPIDAFAVVSSSAVPGWTATVDDREAPWLTADVIRRAVAIPAGTHRVHWRYRTPGMTLALVLAALGIAALIALSLVRGAADRASDPAPVHGG